jgi:hypothetical protein
MPTNPNTPTMPARTAGPRRWAGLTTPLVSVGIGIAYFIAGWLGGDLGFGLAGLALMTAVAIVLVLVKGRSETVAGLLDRTDERINDLDLKATAFAGLVVILAVIAAFVVELARGQDGSPYSWLGALGGVSYVVALVTLRLRR